MQTGHKMRTEFILVAALMHKISKGATVVLLQFSPAVLSWLSFIYSISFDNIALKILKITSESDNKKN